MGSQLTEIINLILETLLPEIAILLTWFGPTVLAIISSGKLLNKVFRISNNPREFMTVPLINIDIYSDDIIFGIGGFFPTFVVIGLFFGKEIPKIFRDQFGLDLFQVDSIILFSSLITISWVFVIFIISNIPNRRDRRIKEHTKIINELSINKENLNGN